MRSVSVLCSLGRLVLTMTWVIYDRLCRVVEWLWRRLVLLWRCTRTMCRPLLGYAYIPIGWWRQIRGSQVAPETNDEDKLPEGGYPEEAEEESRGEGQQAAAAEKRPAGCSGELTCTKRPRFVEQGDEFDSEEYRVETSDELYCGYDSTWETEEPQSASPRTRRAAASKHYNFSRFQNAARDMQNYRHGYLSQTRPQRWMKPVSDDKPNLEFYLGLRPSRPDGVYIHNFHDDWYGEYDTLEYVHSYIQWLFPLQEPGMNYEASPLTKEEIQEFLQSRTAQANLLESYKLMLDFYGIELCDEKTGEVQRASNWRERFNNLNSHTHNNLRITRILKCQGTLGFPHYQAPLVRFFLEETLVNGELPNVKDSVLNYFVFAVLNKTQRRSLLKFAYLNYDRKDEFVWCPKKVQMKWSGLSVSEPQTGMNGENDAREPARDLSMGYLSLGDENEDEVKDKVN